MCIALVAVVASVSGLNVAQQHLATDLGASQSNLLWIINGYTIALAALLLPIGAVGDRWGRRPVLLTGLVLFLGASLGAALSSTVSMLLVMRVLGGVGAAMIMPVTLSVITSTFPGDERERAIGIWAGFAGAGGILGLVVSSFVVDNVTWPWVFALPIVMAAAALALSIAVVPHSKEHAEGRFDTVGSILSAVAIGAFVLGIHEGPEVGWTAPIALGGLLVGLVAGIAFVVWELRQANPLLNLQVFKNRSLAGGSLTLFSVFALLGALFLVLVQFLQAALGYSAVKASLSLLPLAAIMMPLSSVAPLIARRVGIRMMLVAGSALMAVGLGLMAMMASVSGGYWSVLPGLLVMSIGIGLSMTPGTTAITGSLPAEDQGVASALNDTVRELGTAMGVALIGSMLSAGYSSSVAGATSALPPEAASHVKEGIAGAAGVSQQMAGEGFVAEAGQLWDAARAAFVDGWTGSMWLSAGIAVLTAVFAFVWLPKRADDIHVHAAGEAVELGALDRTDASALDADLAAPALVD
jgi:EmrB/QacA subfamily drug resistance transporter